MYTICGLVYWTQEKQVEFKTFLALNPEARDVKPNAGGSPRIDHKSTTVKLVLTISTV